MEYLADTVAIVRHLRGHPALGPQAAQTQQHAPSVLSDVTIGTMHMR